MLFFIYRDRNPRRDKLIYSYIHHFLFPFLNGLKIVFTIYCYQAQEKRDKMMVCHYQLRTGLMIHEPKNTKKRAQLERTQDNKDGVSKKNKWSVYYQIGPFFQECPFKKGLCCKYNLLESLKSTSPELLICNYSRLACQKASYREILKFH